MLISKLRLIRTTGAGRRYCVISMTWLAFGWVSPAFPADTPAPAETGPAVKPASSLRLSPIVTRFGGNIGYDIEQRSISGASSTLRQRIILNLQGKAITYISKPWIALVKANIHFTATKNKFEDSSSSSNSVWGDTGLFLVPYSRYPFEAIITKTQNLSGPGLGSLTSQTTRLDLSQRYNPKDGKERYQVGYNRSKTEDNAPELFRQSEWNFNMGSSRFKKQTIQIEGFRQHNTRQNNSQSSLLNQATVEHRYLPSAELSLNNNAILRNTYEYLSSGSILSRNREVNSIMSFQPSQAPYTILGTARVNLADYDYQQNPPSYTNTANANLGGNYRPSTYITLSASGNVNVTEKDSVRSRSVYTYQSASANYPIASFDLGGYHYSSRFNSTISNRTSSSYRPNTLVGSQSGSVQTVSVSPSHSLSRGIMLASGKLDLRFDQSFLATESTSSQAIARLTHSAMANWRRANTSLRLSARDSRSLNSTQDTFQYINLDASVSEEINRNSTLSGLLSVQTTRQIGRVLPDSITTTSSSAALHYSHRRAFNVPRLIFDSDLRAYSRASLPVFAASPNNQGPVDWENTLSYVIGRLVADFKVVMSKEGSGKSRSLIWFSVKRYF